jgi:hypothetical protein
MPGNMAITSLVLCATSAAASFASTAIRAIDPMVRDAGATNIRMHRSAGSENYGTLFARRSTPVVVRITVRVLPDVPVAR